MFLADKQSPKAGNEDLKLTFCLGGIVWDTFEGDRPMNNYDGAHLSALPSTE